MLGTEGSQAGQRSRQAALHGCCAWSEVEGVFPPTPAEPSSAPELASHIRPPSRESGFWACTEEPGSHCRLHGPGPRRPPRVSEA